MPTYVFECPKGHKGELFFALMSEAPKTLTCDRCGAKAERIIAPGAGFTFAQPGGTTSGAKKEAEVHQAMKDYAQGNKPNSGKE